MANEQFAVKGLAELNKFLTEFPAKLEQNALRGGLRAGANVFRDEARRLVPVDSEALRRSIKVSTGSKRGLVKATVRAGDMKAKKVITKLPGGGVKVRYQNAFYAHWVEFGTKKHLIKVRPEDRPQRMTRRGLRAYSIPTINRMVAKGSLIIGRHFVGPVVQHPGANPQPFMRPAVDRKKREAVDATAAYLRRRIEKERLKGPDR
jgi:HK97 gp10 family phage protein